MKLQKITDKITKRISEYIEFDVSEIFNQSDYITIYGGSVRDSIAGLEIHDIDILCMPDSAKKLRSFLINNKKYKTLYLYDIDALNMYKGISIIQDPWTLINEHNKIIQIIRPSFGNPKKNNSEKLYKSAYYSYKSAYYSLLKNVDLSCCGVFIEKYEDNIIRLKESCKNAIIQCSTRTFEINNWSTLYNKDRTNFREYKLTDRGWINLNLSDFQFSNIKPINIKLQRNMKIKSLELIPEYDYKIWTDDEVYKHSRFKELPF